MSTFYIKRENNDLIHYGVLGMKWGIRRYQNPDGSLTALGRKKYAQDLKTAKKQGKVKEYVNKTIGENINSIDWKTTSELRNEIMNLVK